jgi:hypothetical protein
MHVFANGQLASAPAAAQEATPASEGLEAPMVTGVGTDNLTPVLTSIIGRDTTPVIGSDGKFYVVYERSAVSRAFSQASGLNHGSTRTTPSGSACVRLCS